MGPGRRPRFRRSSEASIPGTVRGSFAGPLGPLSTQQIVSCWHSRLSRWLGRTGGLDRRRSVYNNIVMERIGYGASEDLDLDSVFSALADPTRRAILARLRDGDASVGEIASPFPVSQPAISRHLKVLERAGLIERETDRQRRLARLKAGQMALAVEWLDGFREFWGASFAQLDRVLEEMKRDEPRTEKELTDGE